MSDVDYHESVTQVGVYLKGLEARIEALETAVNGGVTGPKPDPEGNSLDRVLPGVLESDSPKSEGNLPDRLLRTVLASDTVAYHTAGNFQSAIAAADRHLFWCFVGRSAEWPENGHTPENVHFPWIDQTNDEDPRLKLVVAHRAPNGQITHKVVKTGIINSPAHCAPSIGIDADGYLHVAGDMIDSILDAQEPSDPTSTDWIYYRSSVPYNISSWEIVAGSTQRGGLPHSLITYPTFCRGSEGELFCSYKFRLGGYGEEPAAAGLARWNREAKRWDAIGGNNIVLTPTPAGPIWDANDLTKVFCASRGGAPSGSCAPNQYGHYKQTMWSTADGRLHLATHFIGNEDLASGPGSEAGQAVVYAYTDDGGEAWHRADGSLISTLPITVDPNTTGSGGGLMTVANSGVVITVNCTDTAGRKPTLTFDPVTGYPVIAYSFGAAHGVGVKRWTGEGWEEVVSGGGYLHPSGGYYVRVENGVLEGYDDGWQAIGALHQHPSNNRKVDWQTFMETGDLVMQDLHIVNSGASAFEQSFVGSIVKVEFATAV